jgi:rod shape-determining protein MreC
MYRDSRRLRLLFTLLIVLSFTLITIDYRAGEGTVLSGIRSGARAVFGPVQRAVNGVVEPVGNALSSLGDLGSLRDENSRLEEKVEDLTSRLRLSEDERRRLAEMEKLLGLSAAGGFRIVAARTIGVGLGGFEWTVTIDAGTNDGIREDQTVINGDGLVGRVLSAEPWTAQVLLANDATFKVGVRLAGSGVKGILQGDGRRPMALTLIDPESPVEVGQAIVTGADGSFVPGVPVGVVDSVTRRPGSERPTVVVRPYVSYTSLDTVGVVVAAPRTDPRDALLPTRSPTPRPTGAPAPTASPGGSPTGSPGPSPSPTPR